MHPSEPMARLGVRALALALLVMLPGARASPPVSSGDDDYSHCEGAVKRWAASSVRSDGKNDRRGKLSLKDLLFFLHIPRTGGRTYYECFLKKLYTRAEVCPVSYDELRFDPSHPNCKLAGNHDDYSVISKLPRDRTSVITILRNPVDRVFSTYEFSVEAASGSLVYPNLTFANLMTSHREMTTNRTVYTRDVWPWKYLVPWMREDLFARRDARGISKMRSSKKVNAYDVEDMVMPLYQYINDPIAHEIIHNGATFQITGLTNNSYFDGAHEVRHCVRNHPDLGRLVLDVAKDRLDQMMYVGLTEDHEESSRLFAHLVGAQVLSQSVTLKLDIKDDLPNGKDVSHQPILDPKDEEIMNRNFTGIAQEFHKNQFNSRTIQEKFPQSKGGLNNGLLNITGECDGNGNMSVGKLMDVYETCVAKLQKYDSNRRKFYLKEVDEANFSKEARKLVPKAILKQIITLNSLDIELYEHAKKIFTKQQLMLKAQDSIMWHHKQLREQKGWMGIIYNDEILSPWMVVLHGLGITAIIVLVSITAKKRRRMYRVKV